MLRVVVVASAPGADGTGVADLLRVSAEPVHAPIAGIVLDAGAGSTPAARAARERLRLHLRAHGGCLSCALRGDLREQLRAAAARGARTAVVGLPPGVDPATLLCDGDGDLLTDAPATLSSVVGVVDAATLTTDLTSEATLAEVGAALTRDDDRRVADVLIGLVEDADVVALAVSSRPGASGHARGEALVRALNPTAAVLPAAQLGLEVALEAASLRGDGPPLLAWHGNDHRIARSRLGSGVELLRYKARRPLHPERFAALLEEPDDDVVRSTGTLWLATRPDLAIAWDQRGPSLVLEAAHRWVAADPTGPGRRHPEHAQELTEEWHPYYGDRAQRMAFVGLGLDAEALTDAFDRCLLTDRELAVGVEGWAHLPDPLPPLPLPPEDDASGTQRTA